MTTCSSLLVTVCFFPKSQQHEQQGFQMKLKILLKISVEDIRKSTFGMFENLGDHTEQVSKPQTSTEEEKKEPTNEDE